MAMPKEAVEAYVAALPADRKAAMEQFRKVIKKNLPKGFVECMAYGMIGYVVPLSTYPPGYHCNPRLPLMLISVGSQKNAISLHHMGLYGNTPLMKWFVGEYEKLSMGKIDMGKACVRFKKMDQIPFQLIGELCTKITVEQWIAIYETNLSKVRSGKASVKK
ncbi:MAG: DUF1801 domain-containing protein [Bacteroidetes bacterium]|nr:DUF1801 domain-containing protein [Bacteroidota bacterium]